MITIGVDFHKRTSTFFVLSVDGKKMKSCKLENVPEAIRNFITSVPGPKRLAVEATRSWGMLHNLTHDLVDEFHLGHPKKMKAITTSETKTDKKDAEIIAKLAHSGFFPEAYASSVDTRQLRSLLRFRHFLVNQRRSIRNQVQTLLDRNIWPVHRPDSFKNPFCKRGLAWLKTVRLPDRERFILNQCLNTFEELNQKIQAAETYLKEQTFDLPGLEYLRTVPGFKSGRVNALMVLIEIADIHRFSKAKALAHYSGLIPREFSSGDKHRTGHLIKEANHYLRTAFIESTLAAIRSDQGLKAYYKQVKTRSGSGSAIIACARKLSYSVYHVLKEQRAYWPEPFPPAAACHSLIVSKV